MNTSSSYFGSRTGMSSDSRRSLIRVRQEPEEKIKLKQHVIILLENLEENTFVFAFSLVKYQQFHVENP
jgi:hypothetical protein